MPPKKVIFLGSKYAEVLFPHGENPIGKKVYYKGIPLLVVGVQQKDAPASWANTMAFIPYSTFIELFGDQNITFYWVIPKISDNAAHVEKSIIRYFWWS